MATREKLIEAGLELFHKHGIHPVGLDRILHKAGVTKTTFYKYFESKENFTCEVIDRFGEEIHTNIHQRIDKAQLLDTKQKLMQVFDAWDELFDNPSFQGCMLVGAGVASADVNDPARQAAIKNKRLLLDTYVELASKVGVKNPRQFAIRFGVLVDGALVAKQLYGASEEANEAHRMAEQFIDDALQA
ncbi:MAG: TetR/AcrR family transcriptional regulator [Pirellulales bacterium]|nr:TetR/AcrR family transcriptional regulator [Pirellulales bacterium]